VYDHGVRVLRPIGIVGVAALATAAVTLHAVGQGAAPAATTVIHFSPPSTLTDEPLTGFCRMPSTVAWFRADAWTCGVGSTSYDPCFQVAKQMTAWCVTDPRQPSRGTLIKLTTLLSFQAASPEHRAWFFELTDGSTCRPLPGRGRLIEGDRELYGCQYASGAEADAVLGDLDTSAAVWTIHKVLINKKTEPQTIKSLVIASVRTVWQ